MIHIYTDGGCSGNPGPGAWAFLIIQAENPRNDDGGMGNSAKNTENSVVLKENYGAERSTTNNRMELQAVIAAFEALYRLKKEKEKITVYTDSQYIQKGMSSWLEEWKKRGWKTSDKKPVKNQDLWQCLEALSAGISITWAWVKGHAGNEFNEHCDKLTQKAIASLQ